MIEEFTLRILLADDDPQVCSALRLILEQDPLTSCIADVESADQLLDCTRLSEVDLVLLDWYLPGLHQPAHVFAYLRKNSPQLQIVAMGAGSQSRQIALALGADAYISKSDPPEELLKAVNLCRSHKDQV
jgi:two-component system, NarL family, invasion response regulator UvrY